MAFLQSVSAGISEGLLTANAPGATLLTASQDPNCSTRCVAGRQRSNPLTWRATDPNREDNYNRQATVNLQHSSGVECLTIGYVANWSRNNERARPLNLIDPATEQRRPQFSDLFAEAPARRITAADLDRRRFSNACRSTELHLFAP